MKKKISKEEMLDVAFMWGAVAGAGLFGLIEQFTFHSILAAIIDLLFLFVSLVFLAYNRSKIIRRMR